jgi:hypothetical protein
MTPTRYVAEAILHRSKRGTVRVRGSHVVLTKTVDLSAMDGRRRSPPALRLATRALPEEVTSSRSKTPAHMTFADTAHSASTFCALDTRE